jgi:glycosyltransferase involved in cell wall biosynthesis
MPEYRGNSGKTHVLHVIYSLEVGGAERDLVNKLKMFDPSRYAFSICCLVRRGEFAEKAEKLGAKIFCLEMKRRLDPGALFRLRRLIRASRCDLLHLHLFSAGLLGRLAALGLGIPVIYTVQSARPRMPAWRIWCERILARRAARIIGSSEAVVRVLGKFGVDARRLTAIYNAVDFEELALGSAGPPLRDELGIGKDTFVIGTVARLRPVKGVRHLIKAAARIRDRLADLRILIAGDGPEKSSLAALCASLGLEEKVIFLGTRRDAGRVIEAMDLFVLSSDSEAFGIAVAEAMGCRKPVIASRVGGIPEIITDGDTGYLFSPGDVGELAEKIMSVYTGREDAQAVALRGEKAVKARFSAAVLAEQTEAVYQAALSGVKAEKA